LVLRVQWVKKVTKAEMVMMDYLADQDLKGIQDPKAWTDLQVFWGLLDYLE
jgi:hypothetical protein